MIGGFDLMESSVPYTLDDYKYIYAHYPREGCNAVAEHLGRTPVSIEAKAVKMNLCPSVNISKSDHEIVKKYRKELGTALVFLLPHLTTNIIEELIADA